MKILEGGPPSSHPDPRAKYPGIGSGNVPEESLEQEPSQIEFQDLYFASHRQLSNQQQFAVDRYIKSTYIPINQDLRDGKEVDTEILDSCFTETSRDWVVYRGLNGESISSRELGSVEEDKGFVSTSISAATASNFSRMTSYGLNIARIRIPKGSKICVGSLGEQEIILPRNTKFKLTSKTKLIEHYVVSDYEIVE